MSNQNNVKLTKEQEDDYWKDVTFASSRKSKDGKKISVIESVNILKNYFGGDNPKLDINSELPGQKGWTALYLAAYFGCVDECKVLLKMGAKPDVFVQKGNSILHIAAGRNYASLCNVLIKNGFDVDKVNLTGKTSLMSACQSGAIDSSKELLENNASVDIIDFENKTCFNYANDFTERSNDKEKTMETILLDYSLRRDVPINQTKSTAKAAMKF